MLYKMDLLCIEEQIYSVINIRLPIEQFSLRKRQRKIVRKVENNFRVCCGKAQTNEAKEQLYQKQKKKFKGFIHPTLSDYLSSGFVSSVFDTYEVCVYDHDKLISVSFFDKGEKALASLIGLYDEDYASYSLGIYTMLKEVEFGQSQDMRWYYPGYVLDRPSQFNYKLRLGDFEYYNANQRWSKYENFIPSETKSFFLIKRLNELEALLIEHNIEYQFVLYPLFSMGYIGYWNAEFIKFPGFFMIKTKKEEKLILSYDLDQEVFVMQNIVPAPNYEHLVNMEASGEFQSRDNYLMRLMMVSEHICISPELDTIRLFLKE
ncbi:MAG: arginyl-tRNA--protein-N-Asp/Glu arginylyltransferase [Flavobacteriales bacterium]|jgi:arginyl-tRNA--protein-N-Asp/Glu arginylyltransferase